MDKSIKLLIVLVVILVAALGVSLGLLLGGYLSSNKNTTVVNNTSTIMNQTNNTTSTPNYISADQAIEIAKASGDPGPYIRYGAVFVDGSRPYWKVSVYDDKKDSPRYGEDVGGVYVDAVTGEIIGQFQ